MDRNSAHPESKQSSSLRVQEVKSGHPLSSSSEASKISRPHNRAKSKKIAKLFSIFDKIKGNPPSDSSPMSSHLSKRPKEEPIGGIRRARTKKIQLKKENPILEAKQRRAQFMKHKSKQSQQAINFYVDYKNQNYQLQQLTALNQKMKQKQRSIDSVDNTLEVQAQLRRLNVKEDSSAKKSARNKSVSINSQAKLRKKKTMLQDDIEQSSIVDDYHHNLAFHKHEVKKTIKSNIGMGNEKPNHTSSSDEQVEELLVSTPVLAFNTSGSDSSSDIAILNESRNSGEVPTSNQQTLLSPKVSPNLEAANTEDEKSGTPVVHDNKLAVQEFEYAKNLLQEQDSLENKRRHLRHLHKISKSQSKNKLILPSPDLVPQKMQARISVHQFSSTNVLPPNMVDSLLNVNSPEGESIGSPKKSPVTNEQMLLVPDPRLSIKKKKQKKQADFSLVTKNGAIQIPPDNQRPFFSREMSGGATPKSSSPASWENVDRTPKPNTTTKKLYQQDSLSSSRIFNLVAQDTMFNPNQSYSEGSDSPVSNSLTSSRNDSIAHKQGDDSMPRRNSQANWDLYSENTFRSHNNRMNMMMRALSFNRRQKPNKLQQLAAIDKTLETKLKEKLHDIMKEKMKDIATKKLMEHADKSRDTDGIQTKETIQKQKNIFGTLLSKTEIDSEPEEEKTDKNELVVLGLSAPTVEKGRVHKRCMFYPDDNLKVIYWDLIQSIILLITCILTPFNLAFFNVTDNITWYVNFNYAIDVLFLIDIIINFNTAYTSDAFEIVDDRKQIAKDYLSGWFTIDVLAIIPFDLLTSAMQNGEEGSASNMNQFVRITRVSKLYKLVKITRLIRLIKVMKKKKQIAKNVKNMMKGSQQFERLSFFLLIVFLMCHLIGCLWIFVAITVSDPEDPNSTWIEKGNYQDMSTMELYATATYFTMQTLTTVGYGDIALANSAERVFCIFIQLIGVISFSFTSGSLTNIIANQDNMNAKNQEKVDVLNKIFKEYKLPSDLYYQLMTQIQMVDDKKELSETHHFLDQLPFRLKIRTIMYLYKQHYEKINYLSQQSESFLGWICPLLKQEFIPVEQYIYYETDLISEVYFLTQGVAGFILPFQENIVYIEINNGDYFGEIDLVVASSEHMIDVEDMFENMKNSNFNIVRQFTVQAIEDTMLMTISLTNLQRMQKQFNAQFKKLFRGAEKRLQKALKLKFDSITNINNPEQIITEDEFHNSKQRHALLRKLSLRSSVQIKMGGKAFDPNEPRQHIKNLKYFKGAVHLRQVYLDTVQPENDSDENEEEEEDTEEQEISAISQPHGSEDHSERDSQQMPRIIIESEEKQVAMLNETLRLAGNPMFSNMSQQNRQTLQTLISNSPSKQASPQQVPKSIISAFEENIKSQMVKQTQIQLQRVKKMQKQADKPRPQRKASKKKVAEKKDPPKKSQTSKKREEYSKLGRFLLSDYNISQDASELLRPKQRESAVEGDSRNQNLQGNFLLRKSITATEKNKKAAANTSSIGSSLHEDLSSKIYMKGTNKGDIIREERSSSEQSQGQSVSSPSLLQPFTPVKKDQSFDTGRGDGHKTSNERTSSELVQTKKDNLGSLNQTRIQSQEFNEQAYLGTQEDFQMYQRDEFRKQFDSPPANITEPDQPTGGLQELDGEAIDGETASVEDNQAEEIDFEGEAQLNAITKEEKSPGLRIDPNSQFYMTNYIVNSPVEAPNRLSFQNIPREPTPEFYLDPPTDVSHPILSPQNIVIEEGLLSNTQSASSLPNFLMNEPKQRKMSQASKHSHGSSRMSRGSRVSKVSQKSKLSRQSKNSGVEIHGFFNSKETEQQEKLSDSEGELEAQIGALQGQVVSLGQSQRLQQQSIQLILTKMDSLFDEMAALKKKAT